MQFATPAWGLPTDVIGGSVISPLLAVQAFGLQNLRNRKTKLTLIP